MQNPCLFDPGQDTPMLISNDRRRSPFFAMPLPSLRFSAIACAVDSGRIDSVRSDCLKYPMPHGGMIMCETGARNFARAAVLAAACSLVPIYGNAEVVVEIPVTDAERASRLSLAEAASAFPSFSILASLIEETFGIEAVLGGDDEVTLFGPTNAAIESYLAGLSVQEEDALLANENGLLEQFLAYHVTIGDWYRQSFPVGSLQMLSGDSASVYWSGEILGIQGVELGAQTIFRNGMFYGLDAVLEPPGFVDALAAAAGARLVSSGYSGLDEEGSVRFRQTNTGAEIYLGQSDLGSAENRITAQYPWDDGAYQIAFSYDGVGSIGVSVEGSAGIQVLSYAITPQCGDWDTLDIQVTDRSSETGVALNDVFLNELPLGDFGALDLAAEPGIQNWSVTGFDFTEAWTLTASLAVENFSGSAELNKVQLTVGCLP